MKKLTDVLQRFPSTEQYLLSPDSQPEGSCKAELQCGSEGGFLVCLPKAQQDWKRCWLVLINAGDRTQRFLFPGMGTQKQLSFDLSDADDCLFQQRLVWLGYLALEKEGELLFSRLKQRTVSDTPIGQPAAGLTAEDGGVLGTVAQRDIALAARLNVDRNTLYFSAHPLPFLQVLQENALLHTPSYAAGQVWPFDFSVVIPVYNAEEYLEEAVRSVLEQDIGFESHIQLILVDDGSTDTSPALCDAYASQYPRNIKVLHKTNGGASSARNAGIAIAEGKYIHFLDSDDKISLNTYSSVQNFFDPRYQLCDMVALPVFFFERDTGSYYQNGKFEKGSRIINLWREPFTLHFAGAATIFKHEALEGRSFHEQMHISEDARLITEILLDKMQLGVVSDCAYWYRKRSDNSSLVDNCFQDKSIYLSRYKLLVDYLQSLSRRKYGIVPKFVQYALLTESQPRFMLAEVPNGVLNRWEERTFRRHVVRLIQASDDDVICSLPLGRDYKVMMFRLKYGKPLELRTAWDRAYLFAGNTMVQVLSLLPIWLELIHLEDHKLELEGRLSLFGLPEGADVALYLRVGNNYFRCEKTDRKTEPRHSLFGDVSSQYPFRATLPITDSFLDLPIQFALTVNGHVIVLENLGYGPLCPLSGTFQTQSYCKDGFALTGSARELCLRRQTRSREEYEQDFEAELETHIYQQDPLFPRPALETDLTRETYEEVVRLRWSVLNRKKDRPIWVISDRPMIADDNGAALFRYLMAQKDLPADVYFVISKDSPDYEKMAAIGPVLDYNSEEHFAVQLAADLVISSQSKITVRIPYSRQEDPYNFGSYFCDLLAHQDVVFLQHGITKDDVSNILGRYAKNFSGFVTAAKAEYQSILDYEYHYPEERIWLTGFPRFDLLYQDEQKQVTLCPTWRMYLRDQSVNSFRKSPFYRFYHDLITDSYLQEGLKRKGYTLCLKLHPELLAYEELFASLPVTILPPDSPYRKMFAESDLLVTDYSSAVMDFAYLRKPVVYCQFDEKEFFSGHYKPGYYDYRRHGFGPVTATVGDTVTEMLKIVENECRMTPEYQARADSFFLPRDTENCRRVYEKLLALQAQRDKQ